MSTVGKNILYFRTKMGLTQEELAKKVGYTSKSTINKIEKGINDIPQSKIRQFAEVLGTTPSCLVGWSEEGNVDFIPVEPELSEGEKLLLELFRKVPEDKQKLVLQMIRVALENQ